MASIPPAKYVLHAICGVACNVIIAVSEICVGLLNVAVGITSVVHKNPADLSVSTCLIILGAIFIISSLYHLQLIFDLYWCSPSRRFLIPSLIVLNLITLAMIITTSVLIFTRDSRSAVNITAIALSGIVYGIHSLKDFISCVYRREPKKNNTDLLS